MKPAIERCWSFRTHGLFVQRANPISIPQNALFMQMVNLDVDAFEFYVASGLRRA